MYKSARGVKLLSDAPTLASIQLAYNCLVYSSLPVPSHPPLPSSLPRSARHGTLTPPCSAYLKTQVCCCH
ncbi:hypothetical protein E2C01_029049 [Portunus trituberculatus]|uniref:Uncharacterized protein n=1 Tax=Portunus trituberculatus TaxID=210409 RepID=A0A5B7ERS7_PORTR|nr:hypothetical protein [Portunus trituberculatus]